jgi:hypothetical protein
LRIIDLCQQENLNLAAIEDLLVLVLDHVGMWVNYHDYVDYSHHALVAVLACMAE